MTNKASISALFQIQFPIVQAGMVWCSGSDLAAAVSEAGGLGLLGSGSMYSEELREEIRRVRALTQKPFGVNVPLMYKHAESHIRVIIEEKVPIVFTSAGSPEKWTSTLKAQGIKVVHVVSSTRFALKAQQSGCDAVVAEGFEAGGHNGREETTTMCLVPAVCAAVQIPVIAAGGIGSGKAMAAAFALGASGVQVGSRFIVSNESNAHPDFKNLLVQLKEGETQLTLKELAPVRLVKNKFFDQILEAYSAAADKQSLKTLLGKGRARLGMREGNLDEGELEVGQVSAMFDKVQPAAEILQELVSEFNQTIQNLEKLRF